MVVYSHFLYHREITRGQPCCSFVLIMLLSLYLFNTFLSSHNDYIESWIHSMYGGFELASLTVVLTLVLELCSLPTVRSVWKQPGGFTLYQTAWWYNLRNHYLLGIPTYATAVSFLCSSSSTSVPSKSSQTFLQILFMVLLHNFAYYFVHKAFHSTPELYQYHRFHHRFHMHTPPSAANAVSIVEYLVAYVLPFGCIAGLLKTTEYEMKMAILFTSVLNLLVHTPRLDAVGGSSSSSSSSRSIPWPAFWVSPHQHLEHHRKVTVHYASPFLNVDWLFHQGMNSLRHVMEFWSSSERRKQ